MPRRFGLRHFAVAYGLPTVEALQQEIDQMYDVLLGRAEPPISSNRLDALIEVADAYHARANEISGQILRLEKSGDAPADIKQYTSFRTGELRHFLEASKRSADVGSRRITTRQIMIESERTGRSSEHD